MKLDVERKEMNIIIRLSGELDLYTVNNLRAVLEREMEVKGIKNLILNLGKVDFIDSSGLGLILGKYKALTERGGKVVAVDLLPVVKKIFELSGLLKIIPIYDTESQAVADC
ncbi:MAG: anti-sigma F factor antagonist [bacterium]